MMIKEVIIKRRNKLAIKEGYIGLFLRIIIIVIIGYLLFTQVFMISRVEGNQMFPAVKDGDLIIGFRLQRHYEKNDVISYIMDGNRKVGRFIARETDVVTLDDTGTLLINGTVQSGGIIYPTYAKEGIVYPYRVPDGHVFVLGDYRTQTTDSRDFGSIPMDHLVLL